jgi:hypothetical protein
MNLIEQFKAARRAAVPIIAIETVDQQNTIRTIGVETNGIRGLTPLNEPAEAVINSISGEQDPSMFTNPSEMLSKAILIPSKAVLFMSNAHRFLNRAGQGSEFVAQGVGNVREVFKANGATLILLGPGFTFPDELRQDIMVLTEPLPVLDEIMAIIKSIFEDASLPLPKEIDKIADTLIGLSGFAAEQTLATCLSKEGLNREALWERKCKAIEQTPGLSIWRGKEMFSDIGGCENAKNFLRSILKGKQSPRCIVFIDEIEKGLAGIQGDSSGTSQDQFGYFLTWMQDKGIEGVVAVGPAGAAKSALAKAVGNEGGIPTIVFDFGGMKDKFVGESGRKTRQALQIIDAISQGRVLCIATCNSIAILPPELRRRFALGTWFFDLPTDSERRLIWDIYLKKYAVKGPLPNDENWTGAEIRKCAEIAWRLEISLKEASAYIVPVAVSGKDKLEELRRTSSGKFINAGKPGIYQMEASIKQASGKRLINNAN